MFRDRAVKNDGIPVMDNAKIGVNILRLLFDVENVKQLKEQYPKAKYDSVADETYARKKGVKKALAKERYIRNITGKNSLNFQIRSLWPLLT